MMGADGSEDAEVALARLAASGEAGALNDLLQLLWPRLRRAAFVMVRNDQRAQDIAQDTCAEIVAGIWKLRDPSALRPWANRILWRVARRDSRRVWFWERFEEMGDGRSAIDGFDDRSAERIDLARALRRLPIALRAPMALKFVAGLRSHEIGAILGIPAGTVRSRISEGLRRLRTSPDPLAEGVFGAVRTKEARA